MSFAMKAHAVKLDKPGSAHGLCDFVQMYMQAGRAINAVLPDLCRTWCMQSLLILMVTSDVLTSDVRRQAAAAHAVADAPAHQDAHINALQALSVASPSRSEICLLKKRSGSGSLKMCN